MYDQRPLKAALTSSTVRPGTMHHAVLRILATGARRSARQFEGTHPFPQSPRNSWGQRLIELRAAGLVVEDGREDRAGEVPATVFAITPEGRRVLDHIETTGNTWEKP